jgi:ubiquinone/menaquinone biosynthesis C-methylase UbiE
MEIGFGGQVMDDIRPDRIMEVMWANVPRQVLATAVDLGFFGHLAHGARTAAEVAATAGVDERGTRIVLDALAALQFLTKTDSAYALTPETETFLVPGKDTYLGGMVQHTNALYARFGHLAEVVRAGKPTAAVDEQRDGSEFFVELVPQIFALSYPAARAAADALGVGDAVTGITVLDVGAGSGVWSLAMLQRDPTARAIAMDWPRVLEVTRGFAERFGVADRYEYLPGNLREVDFGEGSCDLAILGHICHSEGAENSQRLFRRLHRALRPGGRLLIADMIPDEERKSATFPLLFAVNMLVHTAHGDTFTLSQHAAWLEAAGFSNVRTIATPGPSPLIVADR